MNTIAIIIAAGEGTRWNNYLGIPKHLISIDGETLIERTVSLLRKYSIDDIYVVSNTDYQIANTKWYKPKLNKDNYDADKFLSSIELCNKSGRTITLFGDVFFTEDAIKTIVADSSEWAVFGRHSKSSITGKPDGEIFAHSFLYTALPKHIEMLHYIIQLYKEKIIKRCIGWEHYRAYSGATKEDVGKHIKYNTFVEIDDWTEDFDWPIDYDEFIKRRNK
jgi:hypothetical protein